MSTCTHVHVLATGHRLWIMVGGAVCICSVHGSFTRLRGVVACTSSCGDGRLGTRNIHVITQSKSKPRSCILNQMISNTFFNLMTSRQSSFARSSRKNCFNALILSREMSDTRLLEWSNWRPYITLVSSDWMDTATS